MRGEDGAGGEIGTAGEGGEIGEVGDSSGGGNGGGGEPEGGRVAQGLAPEGKKGKKSELNVRLNAMRERDRRDKVGRRLLTSVGDYSVFAHIVTSW